MQLILLIALLLASGKGGESLYSEVKPLLESVGGEEVKQALKSAEEFKGVLAALGGMGFGGSGAPQGKNTQEYAPNNQTEPGCDGEKEEQAPPFAMAPIAHIADREIVYRLAQYFSDGASA